MHTLGKRIPQLKREPRSALRRRSTHLARGTHQEANRPAIRPSVWRHRLAGRRMSGSSRLDASIHVVLTRSRGADLVAVQ
jgi:hypothetical protein